MLRLIDRFGVDKSAESPTARGSVFFRIVRYDLNCRRRAGDEGCRELIGWDVLPGQLGKNGPIRKGEGPLPVCFDRNGVPQDASKLVQRICFVRWGDQLPLAVSSGNCDTEDRRALLIGMSGREWALRQ